REPRFQNGDALPPAWHWLYFHDFVKTGDLGPDGHPRLGIVMPPVPLPRRMWAGGSLFFHAPLRLGEMVERVTTIRAITPKTGRSGQLYFVDVKHELRSQGQLGLTETQTIVYRELAGDAPAEAPPAPADAEYGQQYQFDSATLFRYSALTFNSHRIHYDAGYCREVEGYPNLVIHGPLLATLLLDLYVEQGQPLRQFRYRARSPLFLPDPFAVQGIATPSGARLWASSHQGRLAMEAEIEP
ncbi:MAG TPA: MaoC family dehydratase N-terminal domain-containing protein, partial [Roseiflexaceae bacterium]|nr:MaoC family dehydratase N-terminal domain-containing protein [Roseiflexaceae bacterium]